MSLTEFLLWCRTPSGINATIGVVLSFVLEWWPAYTEQEPRVKRLVALALCCAVPLAATIASDDWSQTGVWEALGAAFTAFTASQAVHTAFLPAKRAS